MMNREPPKIAFTQGGPKFQGPPMAIAATLTGKAKTPVALNMWVEDRRAAVRKRAAAADAVRPHRQPVAASLPRGWHGDLRQGTARGAADAGRRGQRDRRSAIPASMLRVQANDESGEGGGGVPLLLDERLRQGHGSMGFSTKESRPVTDMHWNPHESGRTDLLS
ncbi:MAG: hypothetical protein U0Q11_22970 [Vicinamibacterales bacterium]